MEKTKWLIDPAHSEVQFKVKHLMITTVTGHFRKFDLRVETEGDDFTKATSILFTADINSVDTNSTQRDTHVKSEDFFAAEKFPKMKFVGKKVEKKGDGYVLIGDLTIRDITKSISVDVEFGGIVADPWGNTRAGFTVTGKIKRKDFNLMWDVVSEAGQVIASNDVRIACSIQIVKQATTQTNVDGKTERAATT